MVTITGNKKPIVGSKSNYTYTGQETNLKWSVIGGTITSKGNKFIEIRWDRIGPSRVDVVAGSAKVCLAVQVSYDIIAVNPSCDCTLTLGTLIKVSDTTYQIPVTSHPNQQQVKWAVASSTTQTTGIAQVIGGRISIPVSGLAVGNYTLTVQAISCSCQAVASDRLVITGGTTTPTTCNSIVELAVNGTEIIFWSCAETATISFPIEEEEGGGTASQFKANSLTGNSQYINPALGLVGDKVKVSSTIPAPNSFFWINGHGPYSTIPDDVLLAKGEEVVIYKATTDDPNPYTGIFTNRGFTQVIIENVT